MDCMHTVVERVQPRGCDSLSKTNPIEKNKTPHFRETKMAIERDGTREGGVYNETYHQTYHVLNGVCQRIMSNAQILHFGNCPQVIIDQWSWLCKINICLYPSLSLSRCLSSKRMLPSGSPALCKKSDEMHSLPSMQ